jgi:hypothetical protein
MFVMLMLHCEEQEEVLKKARKFHSLLLFPRQKLTPGRPTSYRFPTLVDFTSHRARASSNAALRAAVNNSLLADELHPV